MYQIKTLFTKKNFTCPIPISPNLLNDILLINWYKFQSIFFFKCSTTVFCHPIHFLHPLTLFRIMGCCSLSQHTYGKKQGTPWMCHQSVTALMDKYTHIHTYRQFRVTSRQTQFFSSQKPGLPIGSNSQKTSKMDTIQ